MAKLLLQLFVLLFLLNGCSEAIYYTKDTFDPKGLLGIAYYKHIEVKGVLSIDQTPAEIKSTTDGSGTAGGTKTTGGSIKTTIQTIYLPKNKAYLYTKQPLSYTLTTDFKVTETGTPSSSDTQSTQQLTSILGDLGQIAGKVVGAAMRLLEAVTTEKGGMCSKLQPGIYEFNLTDAQITDVRTKDGSDKDTTMALDVKVENGDCKEENSDKECIYPTEKPFDGFCVYDPSPIRITIECRDGSMEKPMIIAGPMIVNSYKTVRKRNPQRNFLTNRHETYTITNGILTEVKYDAQSPIKGAVDVVLSPLKSLFSTLPSSQTQTTTQIQTGGGKPEQITNTYQTTIVPPK
jgi:hypothetical protein